MVEPIRVCFSGSYEGVVLFLGCILCLVLFGACKIRQVEDGALRIFSLI